MRKFKKLTMTLALLITAVGGAWAQNSEPATDPNVIIPTPVVNETNKWTFDMPASNVELQVEYEPELTATFKAGNANTIQSGKATIAVKEKDGTTAYTGATFSDGGKYSPLYGEQKITLTATQAISSRAWR